MHHKNNSGEYFVTTGFHTQNKRGANEIIALFSSAHHFTPRPAYVILVQAETTKSFPISLTYPIHVGLFSLVTTFPECLWSSAFRLG